MSNNKTISLEKQKQQKNLELLLALVKELELAVALSPVLLPRQSKLLQSTILKLVKQI